MHRRDLIKMLIAAPVVPIIAGVGSVKAETKESKKVFLVDPYQVNMEDLANASLNIPELEGSKIVRLRRVSWGKYDPIRRII